MAQPVVVTGKGGWQGIVHRWWGDSGDAHETTIRLDTGESIVIPDSLIENRPDGAYFVPLSLDQLRQAAAISSGEPPLIIPVIHEELQVAKRTVETGGGVRIKKTSREEEEMVDVPLIHEQVEVERVPVDRLLDAPVPVRHIGDTIIIPVVEEVLVVQKRLRLVEEVHIRKKRVETRRPQTFVLRKEQAIVERLEGTPENPVETRSGTDDLRPV